MNRCFSLEAYAVEQKKAFLVIKDMLLFCLAATFFWGLLAHAYGFFHNNLSHDVLNAFSATAPENQVKIEVGRFFVPLYRALFRNPLSLPWVIGCLGLLWTGISVWLVTEIFNVRSRFLTFLIAGVMSTNISYIGQIGTYIHEFDCNAFALLMAVAAAYLWRRGEMRFCLIGSVCLLLSVGIYQSFIAVTVSLILWKSVMELFAEREVRDVFVHGLRGVFMLLLGLVLYCAVSLVVYRITGITQAERTSVLGSGVGSLLRDLPGQIFWSLGKVFVTIFHRAYKVIYRVLLGLLTIAAVISALAVIIRKKYAASRTLLILLLAGLTPLAMGFISILTRGQDVHELMLYATSLYCVFILLFAFLLHGEALLPGRGSEWLRLASCLLVLVLLWQNVVLANTAYVKKELEAESALSTMTRAVARMEAEEGYVSGETPVAFVGVYASGDAAPGMEYVQEIVGLERAYSITQDTSNYYYNAYRAYFDYVLNYPLRLCSDEEHAQLKNDARVQEMPSFPHRDCIDWVDGIMVVKMG